MTRLRPLALLLVALLWIALFAGYTHPAVWTLAISGTCATLAIIVIRSRPESVGCGAS